jgi:hypothetical protein
MATYTGVCFTTVTVYMDSSFPGTLAPIFTDVGLSLPAANPFPCFGNYTFYGAADLYVIQGDFTRLSTAPPVVFAALPDSPETGTVRTITNCSVNTWGTNADGAGAITVLVWYNGTNWTIIGK